MGALPKLWNILERAKGTEKDAVQISINDLLHYVEETVLLLGQSSKAITYHRRLNVLGSVMNSQYVVKSILKNSGTILLTPSNPRNKPKRFLQNTKSSFHLAPHTHRENVRGEGFFSQNPDRKNSIIVTNNNISNVIPTTDRQGVSNRDMVGTTTPQQTFSMDLNPEKPIQWESRKIHPLIKILFLSKSIPDVLLTGRLKYFVAAWMKITQDPKILDIVKGYKIPFHSKPFQSEIPSQPIVSREEEEQVKLEVKEMLKKGAIRKSQPSKGEFVSNLFLRRMGVKDQ